MYADFSVQKDFSTFQPFALHEMQPFWFVVFTMMCIIYRQTVATLFPKANANRICGISHALATVGFGLPILSIICRKSFSYWDMTDSLIANSIELAITCNMLAYTSVSYFLVDSYFLLRTPYLKHHIGALLCWTFASCHASTSIICGGITIGLFELGALLVQLSRMYPSNLPFRAVICLGYTSTRVCLAWVYGFFCVVMMTSWEGCSLYVKIGYCILWPALIFLLVLNAKWTFLQWRALYRAVYARYNKSVDAGEDFFTFHQRIIGNTGKPKSS